MSGKPAWYDAYPPPQNTSPSVVTRTDLLALLQSGKRPGKDFLLVDLRRTDHEVRYCLFPGDHHPTFPNALSCLLLAKGGTIKGSINLPAQSLYYSLPTILNLCRSARIELVIWYCGASSNGNERVCAAKN